MKLSPSLILTPALLLLMACSTHYSAHHGYGNHGHVSVGVHGHGGGEVLGALIVGGIIGHALTEAAHEERQESVYRTTSVETEDDSDAVVNGYSIEPQQKVREEQRKWYQMGQDGNCYLMESVDGKAQIVSLVPQYSCN